MSELVDPSGRPFTKAAVEALTAKYERAGGLVLPLFAGANPIIGHEEIAGNGLAPSQMRSLMSSFITPRDIEEEYADYSETIVNTPGVYNDRFSKRDPISELNKPRDIAGIMNISMNYEEDNFIVNRTIKVKKNFATREMTLLGLPTSKEFYTKEFRRLAIRKWLGHMFRYYWIVGRVVMYWGAERPISGICMLDPRSIVVRHFLSKTFVYMRPDPRWVSILQNGDIIGGPEYKFLMANLPSYWIPYIKDNIEIPLKEEEFALIENDLSLFATRGMIDHTIHGVPLSAAFDALQTTKMLMSGDFSTAWLIKNVIALCSIGDPEKEKDYSPPDQIALQKLAAAFVRPEFAMMAFVDPTVQIRYIYPDPKNLDGTKYKEFNKQIEWVMGVPGVFTSDSGDFSSASLSLKPFREDIHVARLDMIDQFFDKIMPRMREGYTNRKTGGPNAEVLVEFDTDCLKDDKQVQDELNGKWDRGAISNRSLLEGKSRDFDTELERKKEEKKYQDILVPLFDVAHGDPDQQGTGAPGGSNPASNPASNSRPRPGTGNTGNK
jgi:hypothetical protein